MDRGPTRCHPGPVTPSDDLSPPRRPIFFPVVIATVFLTIIGMTSGFVLGERRQDQERASLQQPQQTKATTTPPITRPAPTTAVTSGPFCPPETRELAAKLGWPGKELRQVFKVQTNNGTTVWICGDRSGRLYYQSKTGGLESELKQNENGLFLTDVQVLGENDYQAIASDGTEFLVDDKRLEVRHKDGNVERNEVVG